MNADLVLAVDCSTTGAKAIVWDAGGARVGEGRAPLELSVPAAGYGEQDPRDWWTATSAAIRGAVATIDVARIAALAVTHQRETFACLDEHGDAIRPAMLWLDSRAGAEVEQYGTPRVHRLTGKPVNPTPGWYKLLWIARHEPWVLEATRHVVDVHAYLVHRLTGLWATSTASADPLGLVDLSTGDWSDELLGAVGLDRRALPALHQPGDRIGALKPAAAGELGLPSGLPIIAGAGDGQCAGLGAGIAEPGRAYLNLGTGLIAGTVNREYEPSSAYRALVGAVPGTFDYELFIGAGTYMVNWFADTILGSSGDGGNSPDGFEQYWEARAARIAPGSDGLVVVPYWNGALTPYWDHHAGGVMVGFAGVHGRAHIYRAILEGIAFELRLCVEEAERHQVEPVAEFVAMGGGSHSPFWCQLIADIVGRTVIIAGQDEATSLGAGILAAAGVGVHPDILTAAAAMTTLGARFEPDEVSARRYDAYYDAYRAVYPALRPVFPLLRGAAA
ncbi:FGGY-family carbohydrate kinase [Agromyces sp. C10]|uniref:xylulokinase n=1 Tax=Agromyces sp. C10 TaxID=2935077 RepID=UPI00200B2464|nr:FGGY-family carbohydrate kinase [Agromyces sp. C10]MCK8610110.1 FGGY-family carbohydrate kinase [Agromyces sp. C10]